MNRFIKRERGFYKGTVSAHSGIVLARKKVEAVISPTGCTLSRCQLKEISYKRPHAAHICLYKILTLWQIHRLEKRLVVSEGLDIDQVKREV